MLIVVLYIHNLISLILKFGNYADCIGKLSYHFKRDTKAHPFCVSFALYLLVFNECCVSVSIVSV